MDVKSVADSIGYCGLVCAYCHEASRCGGCKTNSNQCSRYLSPGGCFHYNCCKAKGLKGCWECDIAPCGEDMFSEHHDLRNRVFIKCAKAEGIDKLAEYVFRNQNSGILYGFNKDYDNLGSEEAIISLLHKGKDAE